MDFKHKYQFIKGINEDQFFDINVKWNFDSFISLNLLSKSKYSENIDKMIIAYRYLKIKLVFGFIMCFVYL